MFSRLQNWFGNGWMGIADLLMTALCVFLSLSIRGFAQGFAAYKLGDNTAKLMGRLNLRPTSHLDPIGAIFLLLFGFGWTRPVPFNPSNFTKVKVKYGMLITALAGPLSNFIMAFAATLAMRILVAIFGNIISVSEVVVKIVSVTITLFTILASMNISLAVFHLIPIPPLDGSRVLAAILPPRIYFKLVQYERYSFLILLVLIYMPFFDKIMYCLVNGIYGAFNWVLNLIPFL